MLHAIDYHVDAEDDSPIVSPAPSPNREPNCEFDYTSIAEPSYGHGASQQDVHNPTRLSLDDRDGARDEHMDDSGVNHCLVVNDTESAIELQGQPESNSVRFDSTSMHAPARHPP